jgi:cell division septation protein DedD
MAKERIARIVKLNSNKIYLQIGAFKEKNNAFKMQQRVSAKGIKNVYIKKSRVKRQVLYRVRIGPIKTIDRYDQIINLLVSLSLDMDLVTR